jgi:predicted GTPase
LPGERASEPLTPREHADEADQIREIGLTIIGQVKAGKSSFINALLGEQRAHTDVLPATDQVTAYQLRSEGIPTRLRLFDTVGYGHTGPRADQLRATEEAARQSDLVILVLHARNPARQADVEMLKELRAWFLAQPDLKMPPILGVLTHIDLLSPAMEWAPPYDWVEPTRPKEQQIHEAWAALREQLGEYLVGIVPLCTAPGKVCGLEEWFWPTLVELLDEAHAVALLRCIRAEANTGKVRKVFHQFLDAGIKAVNVLWQISRK